MSPTPDQTPDTNARFPRVSGDEPTTTRWSASRRPFSPRERG